MVRRLVGAFAFACTLAVMVTPHAAGEPVRSLPMQFAVRHEGPAAMCRDKCRHWVSAVGMIRPDTVRDFEAFAEKNDIHGATIVFDSEGGSVIGALALGRAIRRLDMTTSVGKTTELRGKASDPRATLSPRADCESMCAFVLLAGVKRVVPTEARVRVHQIWLGDRREDATAATYSAEDLVLVQRDIGKLAQYTFEMGGSAELLELSLRIPPWEPMRSLTRDELRHTKLDTTDTPEQHADVVTTGSIQVASAGALPSGTRIAPDVAPERRGGAVTTSAPPVQNIRRVIPAGARGWVVDQQANSVMLVRRHPLTVEGETIGTFDVALTCGNAANEYAVLYSETRTIKGANRYGERLKYVSVSMGQKSVSLAIGSSEIASPRMERESFASGMIPASAVTTFAEAGSHSLTVETSSTGNGATSVRVGNTGVAQNFPQLAAACGKRPRTLQAAAHSD